MRKHHIGGALELLILGLASLSSFGKCNFPASESANLITYSFEPLFATDSMALRITFAFKGGPGGEAKLELPSEWAGQQHVENSITQLKALSDDTTLDDTAAPSEKELRFPPDSTVRLSYVLVKDWDGPLNSGTRFRSDLSPGYFHIVGVTSLVHPAIDRLRVMDVHFDWQKLPAEWSLATSFATDDRCQSFHGPWHDALNSLFVGGDYRIYKTTISNGAFNFAIRGKWTFPDEEWMDQVRKITEYERTFWHDDNFPYFLVTLTPLGQDHGSTGGTALTNAFMMHLSRLDPLAPGILATVAHETFHAWNPYKIGDTPGYDYPVSWFFEGFTYYYQALVLYRAGMLSVPDYLATFNEKLIRYAMGPGKNASLEEFIRRHSMDYPVLNQLDGRRGAVLAMWLDSTIRRESGGRSSLDNLMFDLLAQNSEYRRHHNGYPMALTHKRIFRAASKYIRGSSRKEFQKYVELGGNIRIPETALGPCFNSVDEAFPTFDLGFDPESAKNPDRIVSGVEPGSEAYKAGLRDGQKLTGWSFYVGDTSKQVSLTILTGQGTQVFKYYPRGRPISVQQFRLNQEKNSANPSSCVAAMQPVSPRL